ncbi:MAG: hypothetical protein ABSG76_25815 [Xanthobacteraceae bacterium]
MGVVAKLVGGRQQTSPSYSQEEQKIFAATFKIGSTVVTFGIAGVVITAVWANGVAGASADAATFGFSTYVGADLLVAAASAAAGALLGFIFGIPRTLDPAGRAAVATAVQSGGPATTQAVMAANTNLERISDWLTTLLIGATLVQIKDIAGWIGSLGKNLIVAGPAANDAMIPIIVIYYFALSFLGVYLITRLYLTSAFRQTLGMLTAGRQAPRELRELKQRLDAAVKSGRVDDIGEAMADFDDWSFAGSDGDDPELNADVARALVRLIASGATAGRSDPAAELKAGLAKAVADPAVKARLKTELDSGALKTNDPKLDPDIEKALS